MSTDVDALVLIDRAAARPRLKVMHVAETVIGGIASHLEEIGDGQATRFGEDALMVIAPSDQVGELSRLDRHLRPFPSAGNRLISAIRVAIAVVREVRGFQPDIIHLHSTFAGLAVRLLPRRVLKDAKIVYCPHGWSFAMDGSQFKRWAYSLVERMLSRRSDAIINVSAHERDLALSYGLPSEALKVVMNGISANVLDSAALRPVRTGPLRLLFVGRPGRQKGIDILMSAMRKLPPGSIHLDVVGMSRSESGAPDMAGVAFHGWVPRDKVQQFMIDCDALVMSSRWEGLPLTALEAMRAGRTVIASDCCSFGEIVDHGATGLLFETGNAAALAELLRHATREQLSRMGQAARERFVTGFTVEAQERRVAEIYRDLAGR